MNENINLCEILKDCPKGWQLYSTIFGYVTVEKIKNNDITYPIIVNCKNDVLENFTADGKILINYDGECTLFPSKDQRDWNKFTAPWYKKDKFDPKTLKPFDKVIARCRDFKWVCDMFSHYDKSKCVMPYVCVGGLYEVCIPYNNDTKHLIGTAEEAPKYYRYWEN